MTAYSEANALKIDKKIIIDQAIITTKKYSEPNDYKFINAILDNIIK
jgi:transcription termination factor NusB